VDDDVTFVQVLARTLAKRGLEPLCAHDPDSALALARAHRPAFAVVDLKIAEAPGLAPIAALAAQLPVTRIVILTGYASIATAVEAVKLGATHYLCKPAWVDEILAAFDYTACNAEVPVPAQPLSVERLEWKHIQKVLQANGGNV